MGVDLGEWLKYIKDHPLKFRFDGLHSRSRGDKSDFFQTVGEAAVADERFMNDYMEAEFESLEEDVDRAVKDRSDDNDYLSRFCEYVVATVRARQWGDVFPDIPAKSHGWDKVHIDTIMRVVDFYIADLKEAYIRDWLIGDDIQHYWEMIQEKDNAEYLLKDHPPIAAWNNAGDFEVKLEDIFFLCPSCSDPQLEDVLGEFYTPMNGYPYYYCGSCGSEMNVGPKENILDFFNCLDITPYPFNTEKREHWQKLMADRKAWGENKLELKVHERVHLKKAEEREGHFGAGGEKWTMWINEPGEIVEISRIDEHGVMVFNIDDVEHEYFVRFDHLFGRPKEALVP
jgi:hypothetical protein